jgi:hypothetical protein
MKLAMRSRGMPYLSKLNSLFRLNLIGLWPLHETSGATAYDIGPNAFNGTYANISLANLANHLGVLAPLFNGTTSAVTLPDISSKFSTEEGAISLWACCGADLFDDVTNPHSFVYLKTDANNYISMQYDNLLQKPLFKYVNAGVTQNIQIPYNTELFWTNFIFTWSKAGNFIKGYINGHLVNTDACNGNLTAAPANRYIGSYGGYWGWKGQLSDVLMINRAITASEANICAHARVMGVIGDSITRDATSAWCIEMIACEADEPYQIANHAVGGQNIMNNMTAQVSASISDGAAIEIVALGTNDNDAGDMAALQTKVEEELYRLRLLNPHARIYYMNVLPKWENNGAGPEVPKGNIRAAIAAACANCEQVTCWDTYSDPWILQADTSDGTHPTVAGHRKIADRILSML